MAFDKAPSHHHQTVPCNVTLKHFIWFIMTIANRTKWAPSPFIGGNILAGFNSDFVPRGHSTWICPVPNKETLAFFPSQNTEFLIHLQDSIYISDIMVSGSLKEEGRADRTGIISLSTQESITSLLRQEAIFPFKLHRCNDWQIIVGWLLLLL